MRKVIFLHLMVFAVLALPVTAFAGAGAERKIPDTQNKSASLNVEVFFRGTDSGKSDPANNNWTKWIQEKLLKDENISITFDPIPRNDEITALNNRMAAGDAPDICFTYTREVLDAFADQGGLFNMAPYTDTIMKDLKAFLGPDPGIAGKDLIRRYERPTGELYWIPAKRTNTAAAITFIRKDWLSKLGLPIPDSTRDFYNTMKMFKEKDPGGYGTNTIPFSMLTFNAPNADIIVGSFVDPKISDKNRWIASSPVTFTKHGLKEGYRFLNKMYNEGFIDRDFPLYKTEQDWYNMLKNGRVGAFTELYGRPYGSEARINPVLAENIPGAEFIAIDCFKNADGVTVKGCYDITGVFFFIPKSSSDHANAAMRYLNWLSKFENYNFLQVGPEGITHDIVDGLPRVKSTDGLWIMNSGQNLDYTLPINGLDLGSSEKNTRALVFSAPEATPEWIINAYNLADKNSRPYPFVPVTITAGLPYAQTLADKAKVFISMIVTTPAVSFDKTWDDLLKDYLASGAQAIINERTAKWPY
jgi:putative aldouronate transport system substrate-binding protein